MSPPQHPEGTDAGANLPVNIAPPNWQCPTCRTKFGPDLETATACAQAGPAPAVPEGIPLLALLAGHDTEPVFGATEVGPVRAAKTDGIRRHERDVVVAGHQVSTDALATAASAAGGLLIVAPTHRTGHRDSTPLTTSLSSYSPLGRLFLGKDSFGSYRDTGVSVWVDEPSYYGRESSWWAPPNEQQRAALNVVTAGLFDRIAEVDVEQLTAQIRATYGPSHRPNRPSTSPASVAGPKSGLMVAAAHGAPNHIWALRWITAHLDHVTAWQAQTLQDWAAGNGGPIPMPVTLTLADSLPKNPGKRRLAVMEPFGWDYRQVRDAVVAQLLTDAPVNPVPALAGVEETVRQTLKESADHV